MKIHRILSQVAYSMFELGETSTDVAQKFFCYWGAFNAIYYTVANMEGKQLASLVRQNGEVAFEEKEGIKMAKAKNEYSEKKLIHNLLNHFDEELCNSLITSEHLDFFATRTPKWIDVEINSDALGQPLNGVINVGRTSNPNYPIWSPINKDILSEYLETRSEELGSDLSKQLLDLLYTVRNNLVHGSKVLTDANDQDVLRNAWPLVRLIILHFLVEDQILL